MRSRMAWARIGFMEEPAPGGERPVRAEDHGAAMQVALVHDEEEHIVVEPGPDPAHGADHRGAVLGQDAGAAARDSRMGHPLPALVTISTRSRYRCRGCLADRVRRH